MDALGGAACRSSEQRMAQARPRLTLKGLIVPNVKAGRITMDVTNETMGGDPIYGLVKVLKITFTVERVSHERRGA